MHMKIILHYSNIDAGSECKLNKGQNFKMLVKVTLLGGCSEILMIACVRIFNVKT